MEGVSTIRRLTAALFAAAVTLPLSGCVMVGYSSRGGGFIFPGGLGLLLMLALLWLLLRRR